jgi:hypothetical protein
MKTQIYTKATENSKNKIKKMKIVLVQTTNENIIIKYTQIQSQNKHQNQTKLIPRQLY